MKDLVGPHLACCYLTSNSVQDSQESGGGEWGEGCYFGAFSETPPISRETSWWLAKALSWGEIRASRATSLSCRTPGSLQSRW